MELGVRRSGAGHSKPGFESVEPNRTKKKNSEAQFSKREPQLPIMFGSRRKGAKSPMPSTKISLEPFFMLSGVEDSGPEVRSLIRLRVFLIFCQSYWASGLSCVFLQARSMSFFTFCQASAFKAFSHEARAITTQARQARITFFDFPKISHSKPLYL